MFPYLVDGNLHLQPKFRSTTDPTFYFLAPPAPFLFNRRGKYDWEQVHNAEFANDI